jgi:hypothetical protein
MANFIVSASSIADLIPTFFRAKRVPYFVGRPGIAKTAMVREGAKQLAAVVNAPVLVRELHLASMSEVDVRGYLIPSGERALFTQPEFWTAVESCPYGILFLDEFGQATHEVQKAVAPLLLEGRIGEYKLPPGWMVVCAGNSIEDNAGANSLLSHVINRIVYMPVGAPDVDEWVSWAVNEGLPPELIAMAKLRPDVVFESDLPTAPDTPYCTPRSLHTLGDMANAYPGGLTDMMATPIGLALAAGAVGDGAAAEIAGLVRTTLRLPSFDAVMAAPEISPVPTDLSEAYAMVMLVAVRAKGDEHKDAAALYLTRFPVNIALTGIVALIRRDKTFLHSKVFGKWVGDNRELVSKFQKFITL